MGVSSYYIYIMQKKKIVFATCFLISLNFAYMSDSGIYLIRLHSTTSSHSNIFRRGALISPIVPHRLTLKSYLQACVSFHLQSLTTWDSGNQLTYPVKYIDIGYKDDLPRDDVAKETSFHVETSKDSDIIDLPQKDDESIL